MGDNFSEQEYIFHSVIVNEIIYGQPKSYFDWRVEKKHLSPIDFNRYFILISGLQREVYRTYFQTDAQKYGAYFNSIQKECDRLLLAHQIPFISTMLLYDHSKRLCIIFNETNDMDSSDVARAISACVNRYYSDVFDMTQTPYCNYTVLSDEVQGYEHLQGTFKKLDELSKQQYFDMKTMIMSPSLLETNRIHLSREQLHEDITRLRMTVRERERPAMEQSLSFLFHQLRMARDFDLLNSSLYNIRALAEELLASQGLKLNDPEVFSIGQYPTFEHLYSSVQKKLAMLIESLPGDTAMSAPILEAMRYIRHHFTEDVSLADVAKHIDMSPSWLSKHFNQECHMSVPAYLLDVRMEHAKELLIQSKMLVFEVDNAVGFENPRYFVSVFKKAVGVTPTDFRNQVHSPTSLKTTRA